MKLGGSAGWHSLAFMAATRCHILELARSEPVAVFSVTMAMAEQQGMGCCSPVLLLPGDHHSPDMGVGLDGPTFRFNLSFLEDPRVLTPADLQARRRD